MVDEEGGRYACLREWKTEYSMNALITRLDPDPTKVSQRLYRKLNMGMISFEKDDSAGKVYVRPAFASESFHVSIEPQHFYWTDAEGELECEFKALGPALRFLCPGDKEDSFYISEVCRVHGALKGKKIKGFGGLDHAFGSLGVGWLQSKIYRLLERYWIVWANRFEDQGIEYGICFDGEAEFKLGFIVRDGDVKVSGITLAMEHFEDGFPKEARLAIGDETYRFRTTGRVSRIKGFMQWASGEMKRDDETRSVVEAFGWLEFFG